MRVRNDGTKCPFIERISGGRIFEYRCKNCGIYGIVENNIFLLKLRLIISRDKLLQIV